MVQYGLLSGLLNLVDVALMASFALNMDGATALMRQVPKHEEVLK
jgi:hypothetical protein